MKMVTIINFYQLFKSYRKLGFSKKKIWLKFKQIGFPKSEYDILNSMYKNSENRGL